jgi:GTP-binding protein
VSWYFACRRYFMERQTLAAVLLLVDASIPPQAADLEVVSWLGNAQVGCHLGFRV